MEVLKYRKDANSPWLDIVALVGPQGEPGKDGENGKDGAPGKDGSDYVLTEQDKTDIANQVLTLIPSGEEVSY